MDQYVSALHIWDCSFSTCFSNSQLDSSFDRLGHLTCHMYWQFLLQTAAPTAESHIHITLSPTYKNTKTKALKIKARTLIFSLIISKKRLPLCFMYSTCLLANASQVIMWAFFFFPPSNSVFLFPTNIKLVKHRGKCCVYTCLPSQPWTLKLCQSCHRPVGHLTRAFNHGLWSQPVQDRICSSSFFKLDFKLTSLYTDGYSFLYPTLNCFFSDLFWYDPLCSWYILVQEIYRPFVKNPPATGLLNRTIPFHALIQHRWPPFNLCRLCRLHQSWFWYIRVTEGKYFII